MKTIILESFLVIVILQILACTNKQLIEERFIINDVFLSVADTLAYEELSLRPPSPDPNRKKSNSKGFEHKFSIIIPDTLYSFNDKIWASDIKLYCKGWNSSEDSNIIKLKKRICKMLETDTTFEKFKFNKINNIGNYIILKNKTESKNNIPIVGKIQFSKVIVDENDSLSVFAAIISDTEKAGIERLYYLQKISGTWKVIKVEDMAVY